MNRNYIYLATTLNAVSRCQWRVLVGSYERLPVQPQETLYTPEGVPDTLTSPVQYVVHTMTLLVHKVPATSAEGDPETLDLLYRAGAELYFQSHNSRLAPIKVGWPGEKRPNLLTPIGVGPTAYYIEPIVLIEL